MRPSVCFTASECAPCIGHASARPPKPRQMASLRICFPTFWRVNAIAAPHRDGHECARQFDVVCRVVAFKGNEQGRSQRYLTGIRGDSCGTRGSLEPTQVLENHTG